MKHAGLAMILAAAMATATSAATQSQTSSTRSAGAAEQSVTLTGCVTEASDQANLFALKRMDQNSGGNSAGATSTTGNSTSDTARRQNQSGGAASTSAAGTSGTRAPNANTEGAIYRLAAPTTQNLKQFVGRRVEIMGHVMPGRDEKGADVVIHRIEPDKTVVTAIDLKPAPQLMVSSIRELQGTCTTPARR